MSLQYTLNHEISYYECDMHQHLTLPMLVSILIKACEKQSQKLGDEQYLLDHHLGWIITQHELVIHQLPKQNDSIQVNTQIENYNKYFCYRKFEMRNSKGLILAEMISVFSLLDLQKRKIMMIPDELMNLYQAEKTTKLKRFKMENNLDHIQAKYQYRARYLDLDSNGHVNNAHYLDWMIDSLDYTWLEKYQPTKLSIKFEKEISYSTNVISKISQNIDTNQTIHQILDESGVICALSNIQWKEKE